MNVYEKFELLEKLGWTYKKLSKEEYEKFECEEYCFNTPNSKVNHTGKNLNDLIDLIHKKILPRSNSY